MRKKIISIVFQAIDTINKQNEQDELIEKSETIELYGSKSKLDSLGLVNLIVTVEQNIEDEFDIAITLADERAMSQKYSPFRTIGSLVEYIEMLLKEMLSD